jgi:glucosylceramidase
MKDIENWYIGGTPETFGEGTGGVLKEEYVGVYADYLVKYLDAYRTEGVEIWGLTPVNEPHGNSGQWESMHFTPESQRDFIKSELGPKLRSSVHRDIRLLIYDQNRDDMEHWADVILGDPEAAQYVYGTAVHWYASTHKVFEKEIAAVRQRFPGFEVIHTEGTIDNLGLAAPGGIADPERFQESGWFDNDAFWWNDNATDWAYTASWAPNAEDHPVYTPVHRYARNIIVSLNHGMAGWIDWNVVLDRYGGPNHVGNLCGAPIMIDTDTGQIYYTPVYYVLAQLSRTIRPGDRAVHTERHLGGMGDDTLHASAAVNAEGLLSVQLLNTSKQPLVYNLQIGAQFAEVEIPANSIQTVRVALN